ncbi:MAG: hypothetical protein JXM70_25420 [Pirellulales bacterium]|nr:hypothetical protein [Pirellulales bacterium]
MLKDLKCVTHRDTLKFLTASLCLSATGLASAAETKKPRWKTAIGLNGFLSASTKYKKTFPIWEILDYASRTGFDGVELVQNWPMGDYPGPDEKQRIDALKRFYDAFGLQIFSIQTAGSDAFSPNESASRISATSTSPTPTARSETEARRNISPAATATSTWTRFSPPYSKEATKAG